MLKGLKVLSPELENFEVQKDAMLKGNIKRAAVAWTNFQKQRWLWSNFDRYESTKAIAAMWILEREVVFGVAFACCSSGGAWDCRHHWSVGITAASNGCQDWAVLHERLWKGIHQGWIVIAKLPFHCLKHGMYPQGSKVKSRTLVMSNFVFSSLHAVTGLSLILAGHQAWA